MPTLTPLQQTDNQLPKDTDHPPEATGSSQMRAIDFDSLYWSEKSALYILANSNEPLSLANIYNSLMRHAYLNGFFEDHPQAERDDYTVEGKKRRELARWVDGQLAKHRSIQYAASDINSRWGYHIPRYEAMREMLSDFVGLELLATGDPFKNGRPRYYMPDFVKEEFFLVKTGSLRPVRKPLDLAGLIRVLEAKANG